jgi:hypothetical protein
MVQLVAVAKIVYGLGVWLASRASPAESPNLFSDWFYILQLTVFCTAAGLLLAGRGDERARALGTLMLLFGTLFVDPFRADRIRAGIFLELRTEVSRRPRRESESHSTESAVHRRDDGRVPAGRSESDRAIHR